MSTAERGPDLPYPKLPFWDAVSLAYSTYFRHFIDALRASWLWLIVAAALTSAASWKQWSWMATAMVNLTPGTPPRIHTPIEMALVLNLANILMLLAGVSIAVAWHRLIILNEPPGLSGANVTTKNLWRYIGMAIALFLMDCLPAAVVMFPAFYFLFPLKAGNPPPPGFFALIPLILVLYAVGTLVALRFSLLLPAQAVGDLSLTFKQTWRRTRGNTWRLFWGIVVTTLPPLLLAEIAFVTLMGVPSPANLGSEDFVTRMTAVSTIFAIYYLLIVPIGIGFLSHAYRHFFQAPIELAD